MKLHRKSVQRSTVTKQKKFNKQSPSMFTIKEGKQVDGCLSLKKFTFEHLFISKDAQNLYHFWYITQHGRSYYLQSQYITKVEKELKHSGLEFEDVSQYVMGPNVMIVHANEQSNQTEEEEEQEQEEEEEEDRTKVDYWDSESSDTESMKEFFKEEEEEEERPDNHQLFTISGYNKSFTMEEEKEILRRASYIAKYMPSVQEYFFYRGISSLSQQHEKNK